MAWNVLDNITSNGTAQETLVNTLNSPATHGYPLFWAMVVLIPFFLIITGRTFFKQKAREGRADFWESMAVGSFSTTLVALTMNLIGLIDRIAFSWTAGICTLFIVMFLLLKE